MSVSITKEINQEVVETVEDTVQYLCSEINKDPGYFGTMVSGETVWAMVECLAIAKQAEMAGLVK